MRRGRQGLYILPCCACGSRKKVGKCDFSSFSAPSFSSPLYGIWSKSNLQSEGHFFMTILSAGGFLLNETQIQIHPKFSLNAKKID